MEKEYSVSVRRFTQVLVEAVVDHATGYDQAKIGHVQHGAVVSVAVTDLDDDELVPFERKMPQLVPEDSRIDTWRCICLIHQ